MAENHLKLTVFINRDVEHVIHAKQGDAKSRFLDVTLLNDDGVPVDVDDHRVRFNAVKPDKTVVFNDAVVTDGKNGKFTVPLTDQTLAIGDRIVKADISVHTRDEKCILTTRTFFIYVQAMQRNDAALMSVDEYGAILTLMQRIIDLYGYVKQDVVKLQTFNFDNLAALEEVKRVTVFSENAATETITDANTGVKIAERVTTFNADETVAEVIELYGRDGVTVIKRASCTVKLLAGGSVEETSLGYNDYGMLAAYLMHDTLTVTAEEVLYDNGGFAGMTNAKQALDAALLIPDVISWNGGEGSDA